MKYADKLKDPRWQKKRLEILERDKWMCRGCCEKEKTLHVHHIFYVPQCEPWEIPNGLLVTLCCDCHHPKPCLEEYKSCQECPDYGPGDQDCEGPGNTPKDMIDIIGSLLDLLWKNSEVYGGHTFHVILANAHYTLKPE